MLKVFLSVYFVIGILTGVIALAIIRLLVSGELEGFTIDDLMEDENFSYEARLGLEGFLNYPWLMAFIVGLLWPYIWNQIGLKGVLIIGKAYFTDWIKREL